MDSRVLVTGANGFIGKAFINHLAQDGQYRFRGVVRDKSSDLFHQFPDNITVIEEINKETKWESALKGCDVIIHMAARVHVGKESVANPLHEYRIVNVEGTLNLARQAIASGIKRFIYISSIKVNGESSLPGHPFTSEISAPPKDPYARSKYEAENALLALANNTDMDVVIIRPPLVYGPGVKGNFERMIKWVKKGRPLPLGFIKNQRSFVSVINLNSLIMACIAHPNAANQVFLVSDNEDVSVPDLLIRLGRSLDMKARLIPVPYWMINTTAKLLGQQKTLQRLSHSLQVDISKTRSLLNWNPIISLDEALDHMVTPQPEYSITP